MRCFTYYLRLGLTLGTLTTALLGAPLLARSAPAHVPGRILVQFTPGASAEQVRGLVASANALDAGEIPHTGVHVLQLPPQASEMAMVNAFAQRPEVVFAELDQVVQVAQTNSAPNDTYYSKQWHLPKISASTAWCMTTGSSAITIAVLDTGCDPTHPDLAPKYVPGWNVYDNNSNTADVYGHGTAVAGVAAASSNNGAGVASIAWNCMIMPVRISDASGSATYSSAASGLNWAADHGARVANISYQMSDSAAVASAAKYFQSKGGVVTIAAGNSGAFVSSADNPYVLTVSATDSNDLLASWSNKGNNVDIAAPGVNIYATLMGGGYGAESGTSFSAPVVAGVAALALSANPSLSGVQVRAILEQSADDLGASGWDSSYGYGRVNASKAVNLALTTGGGGGSSTPTVSFASPGNSAAIAGSVSVQVNASDSAGVASVTLSLDGAQVAVSTSAPYAFPWNTTAVANGTHVLTAVAADPMGNTASTTISVTVSNSSDTIAPTVSITSPTGGKAANSLTVTASASDNVGVTKVELWVDGKLSLTDTGAPWSFSLTTNKWSRGTHTLQCKAYDAAGNVGLSQVVTLTN